MAAIGILQERKITDARQRAAQLQHALDSRIVVEQAKGVLATKLDVTTDQAFQRLRSHARSRQVSVREVCRRIVEDGFVPPG